MCSEKKKNKNAADLIKLQQDLKQGYLKSGADNLKYAEMCVVADNEALATCEEKLSECE